MKNANSLLEGKLGKERLGVLFHEEKKCISLMGESSSFSLKGVMWKPFVRIKRGFRSIYFIPLFMCI